MGELLTKTCFSPQIEAHTAILYFSVILKHFGGNSHRTSLFSPKLTITERSTEILRKFVFHKMFEKGKS